MQQFLNYFEKRKGVRNRIAKKEKVSGTELPVRERLSNQAYEIDPLECPECGGAMKIIRFIERRQADVIQRILLNCRLWLDFIRTHASPRAPPSAEQPLPTPPNEFDASKTVPDTFYPKCLWHEGLHTTGRFDQPSMPTSDLYCSYTSRNN